MLSYLRLEIVRSLRDPRYVILSLVAPIGFYLLFTSLFGSQPGAGGLSTNVSLMVSMSVFGAMWAVLSATGPRIAQERGIGWLRQLHLLPVRAHSVLVARLLASLVLAGPAIVLVFVTAVLAHGVQLDSGRWLLLLAVLWPSVLPVAALGIAVGYATNADSAFGIIYGFYLVLAALGGLWMPLSMLPSTLQTFGKLLPSYRAAQLGWYLAAGHTPEISSLLILAAWTLALSTLAIVLSSRASRTR